MGLNFSREYKAVRRTVLLPWAISVKLPSLVLTLAVISVGIVPTAVLRGRSPARSVAKRRLVDWHQQVLELVEMPGTVSEDPEVIAARTRYWLDEEQRSERISSRLQGQPQQRGQGPSAFWGANPFLHDRGPDGRPHWRLDRSRPPLDHYDGNELVPTHFTMKPALTPLEKAYVSDPEGHDWSAWKARDEKIRAGVPSIMHSHHIHRCGRFGLYICGTPEEVVCQSDADGVPSAPPRDRMMVFVIELEPPERTKWVDIHAELSMLMYDVGVEENHGVCIRYYLNEDSTHPVGLPRLRMQPIPDTHTGPRGYAATFAEMTAAASWLVGHQARHPQQQNMSAEREAEMIRAIIDANRDSARRRLERENQDIPESSRVEFNTR